MDRDYKISIIRNLEETANLLNEKDAEVRGYVRKFNYCLSDGYLYIEKWKRREVAINDKHLDSIIAYLRWYIEAC